MRYLIPFLLILNQAFAQTITNVSFEQIGQDVSISYDLNPIDFDRNGTISLYYSLDNGPWQGPLQAVSGSIGDGIKGGIKQKIRWRAHEEVTTLYSENVRFKVQASFNDLPIPLPRMIKIPGGSFQMGSTNGDRDETPVHTVRVSTFYLAETEVTFAQYDYFCQQTGRSKPDDEGWGRGNRPVINVSWNDAQAYCQWVSQQTGQRYRLPTEAEWEFAAGGGSSGRSTYAGTSSSGNLGSYAVYSSSKTSPVKSKRPNALGLYDMSGNVYEWCQDWYGDYPSEPLIYPSDPLINPTGPATGENRVLRGGSWFFGADNCRVASRIGYTPGYRDDILGFRLARSL